MVPRSRPGSRPLQQDSTQGKQMGRCGQILREGHGSRVERWEQFGGNMVQWAMESSLDGRALVPDARAGRERTAQQKNLSGVERLSAVGCSASLIVPVAGLALAPWWRHQVAGRVLGPDPSAPLWITMGSLYQILGWPSTMRRDSGSDDHSELGPAAPCGSPPSLG